MLQLILYVRSQAISRDFYRKILNCEPSLDVEGMTEFRLSEKFKLGIMPESSIVKILGDKTPHPSAGNGIPRCELYFYVDDVKESYEMAVKWGAKEVNPVSKRDWGDTAGYLADPDGHIIVFASPTD